MKLISNLRITTTLALCTLALSPATFLAADTSKAHDERGIIKSVDPDNHWLVVTDRKDNKEHKFLWNDETKFTERGKTATAADLKAGERVRITYSGNGDMPTVQRVHIAPAKTEKPASENP